MDIFGLLFVLSIIHYVIILTGYIYMALLPILLLY